jgi:CRISPR-associated protein Cas2
MHSFRLKIFTYDISCDRRRRRVARLLEEEATRVQYSVFEARLTERATARLTARIEKELDTGDSLRVYTVGRTGERHSRVIGDGVPVENGARYWLM